MPSNFDVGEPRNNVKNEFISSEGREFLLEENQIKAPDH